MEHKIIKKELASLQQKFINTPIPAILPSITSAPAAVPVDPATPPSNELNLLFTPWFAVNQLPSTPPWKTLHQQVRQPAIDAHHCTSTNIICNNIKTTPWSSLREDHPYNKLYSKILPEIRDKHANWYEQASIHWDELTAASKFSDWLANIDTNITPAMWEALVGYNKKTEQYNGWSTGYILRVQNTDDSVQIWVADYFLLCFFWWLHPESRKVFGKNMFSHFRSQHPNLYHPQQWQGIQQGFYCCI